MEKTYIAVGLLLIGMVGVAVGSHIWPSSPLTQQQAVIDAQNNEGTPSTGGKYMGIEAYVQNYISDLSPTKAELGGTFYVTKVDITSSTTGVVEYEDGHTAYTADFTYTTDPETYRPSVKSFIVRH